MSLKTPLAALGPQVRFLAACVDALAHMLGDPHDIKGAQALIDTAAERETGRRESWNLGAVDRLLLGLGLKNQGEIYEAAGLTDLQAEVAFLHYDRGMEPREMARTLGGFTDEDLRREGGQKKLAELTNTMRVRLHDANEKLMRLRDRPLVFPETLGKPKG